MEVIVSNLTYVKVANKWHYICLFVDLFNREMNWKEKVQSLF